MGLQLDSAYSAFEEGIDFTVGVEEEFALVDPIELGLVQRFEELHEAAADDPILSQAVAGELISSEIEIRSGRGENLTAAIEAQKDRRRRCLRWLPSARSCSRDRQHPWSDYREQHIIETEHYQRVEEGLKYVAWRNNTFSLHLHVGIQGADRAVQVCDRLRPVAPLLLAISANSPFLDGRDSGLHSARSQIFTKSFPRCGIPDELAVGRCSPTTSSYSSHTNSIVEYTQVWWSLRPHFAFGTVEVRICDTQSTAPESEGLAALIVACVAQAARDIDEGVPARSVPRREIEENFWRAIRHGLDGRMIDLDTRQEYPAGEALDRLLAWSAPARAELGIEVALPELNGAQRQRRMLETGATMREVYAATVEETRETYAGALGSPAEVRR